MNPVANVLESGTTPPLYNKTKPALKQPPHKLSWTRDADCSRGSRCRAPPGLNPANIRRAGRACQLEAAPGLPLSFLPRGTRLDRSTPSLRCRGEPGAPDRPPPRAAPSAAHSHTACEAKVTGREVWVGDRSLAARRAGAQWAARRDPPCPGAECAPPRPSGAAGGARVQRSRGRSCARPLERRVAGAASYRRLGPGWEEWSWRLAPR